MASTYSTSLRLELMATGDQSGTWGDTTNTNLGTLLEQSITGVLSVAQGDVANLTLTSLNGASDQARNAVVNLTGAMTAGRNVVVPTANKLYLIKNSTTGGFAVTVKTAAGTGVAVLAGSSQWVYCDGTNVVQGLVGNGVPDTNGNISADNFLPGYTTTATAGGTTNLTVSSTELQYFTGTTTQTVVLPVSNTMTSLGQGFTIVNRSTGTLTVIASGGATVTTIIGGASVRIEAILLSGTSAASWHALSYAVPNPLTLSGSTAGYTPINLISTEAGAAAGPIARTYRDSSSPAANDILGQWLFDGEDSAGNTQEYASIQAVIVSPTSTTEASTLDFYTQKGGARTLSASLAGPVANFTSVATGYTTTATAAGTTTLTVSSNQQQYFTGTTTQTVVLPVTSTLVLGQKFEIFNNSTGLVTVQSSGANTIQVMGGTGITYAPGVPGTRLVLTCIAITGTGVASWAYDYFTPITQWVAYTPTFSGLGTVTNSSVFSRRVGDNIEIRGRFTTGTVAGTEAQMTLGFNGASGGITIDSAKVPNVQMSGQWQRTAAATPGLTQAEGGQGIVTFGVFSTPTTKTTGTGGFGNSEISVITFVAPILGW